jgi:hypothetical protein
MGARVSSLAGGGTAAGYHGMWRAALLAAGRPGGRAVGRRSSCR